MRRARWTTLAAVAALALGACAPTDEDRRGAAPDATATLATVTDGVLTIATSDPAYEPWVVDNDPTNGEGFESAVAYAVADELGLRPGPRRVDRRQLRPDHRAGRQGLRLRDQPGVDQRRARGEPRLLLAVLHDRRRPS